MHAWPVVKVKSSWYQTPAIDVFCAATGLPDYTGGVPVTCVPIWPALAAVSGLPAVAAGRVEGPSQGTPRAIRIPGWELVVRTRLTTSNTTDIARKRYGVDDWEHAQHLAAPTPEGRLPATEVEALAAVSKYIDEWTPETPDSAYGDEFALAIDLAVRQGDGERVAGWIERRRQRFERSFIFDTLLCFQGASKALSGGLLADLLRLSEEQREEAVVAIEAIAKATSSPKVVPKIQKRTVGGEYSQFHIEPETLDEIEQAQVFFQEKGDTERGLSLFETKVGIGTPSETLELTVEVTAEPKSPKTLDLEGVVRAVAFPLRVRGPLQLRSVDGEDDEDCIEVPVRTYDVLARFYVKKRNVYRVALQFYPAGALGAPKTLRIEE